MPTDPAPAPALSPYERILGPEFAGLHPRLHAYFSTIPSGSIGTGNGVFDVVGTSRRWLWPALWLLGLAGVVFPVWERDVPFTVTNTPADAGGRPAVSAVRRFSFDHGSRDMIDVISAQSGGLVDRLGSGGLIEAAFSSRVVDGGLHLRSTRVVIHLGTLAIPIPHGLAPVVRLTERFDDATAMQQVAVTIDAPLVGRLYQYSGAFRYSVSSGGDPS